MWHSNCETVFYIFDKADINQDFYVTIHIISKISSNNHTCLKTNFNFKFIAVDNAFEFLRTFFKLFNAFN
jgi:hypothetical protein